jgi:hypothetical protein
MRTAYIIQELEAIEAVKAELKKAQSQAEAYEILGRLLNLYSALNVREIRETLEAVVDFSETKAA